MIELKKLIFVWYIRKTAQFNIGGPLQPLPLLPGAPQPMQPNAPEPPPNQQLEEENIEQPQLEPKQPQIAIPLPPLHDNCHCEVKTLPGGRQVWEANYKACDRCIQLRDMFNSVQSEMFGV